MVTICITSFNRGEYIAHCIDSVLAQTYTNLEIIIVDGGSTDQTFDILASYKDPRIKLYIEPEPKGQVVATQSAYDLATGYYIGSVDSDDWIEPDCVEKCVNAIGDAGLVYTKCRWIGKGDRVDYRAYHEYSPERLLGYFITFHFRMFKTELWRKVRPFGVKNYCWDYDLSLKLSEITEFVHLPEVLYHWRRHDGNNPKDVHVDYRLAQATAALRRLQ